MFCRILGRRLRPPMLFLSTWSPINNNLWTTSHSVHLQERLFLLDDVLGGSWYTRKFVMCCTDGESIYQSTIFFFYALLLLLCHAVHSDRRRMTDLSVLLWRVVTVLIWAHPLSALQQLHSSTFSDLLYKQILRCSNSYFAGWVLWTDRPKFFGVLQYSWHR